MGGLHKQRAYEQVRYSFCYAFMVFTPSKDSTRRACFAYAYVCIFQCSTLDES